MTASHEDATSSVWTAAIGTRLALEKTAKAETVWFAGEGRGRQWATRFFSLPFVSPFVDILLGGSLNGDRHVQALRRHAERVARTRARGLAAAGRLPGRIGRVRRCRRLDRDRGQRQGTAGPRQSP